jgi:hypothetical protein
VSFFLIQFLNGLASASSLFLVACGLSIISGVTRIRDRGTMAELAAGRRSGPAISPREPVYQKSARLARF